LLAAAVAVGEASWWLLLLLLLLSLLLFAAVELGFVMEDVHTKMKEEKSPLLFVVVFFCFWLAALVEYEYKRYVPQTTLMRFFCLFFTTGEVREREGFVGVFVVVETKILSGVCVCLFSIRVQLTRTILQFFVCFFFFS
jgi:hypothetical protein